MTREELMERRNKPISEDVGSLNQPLTGDEDFLIDKSSTLTGIGDLQGGGAVYIDSYQTFLWKQDIIKKAKDDLNKKYGPLKGDK